MKKLMTLLAGVCVAMATVYAEPAKDASADTKKAEQTVKKQTLCPVMGNEINQKLYVDFQGKRIYVCCKGCIAEIKKDPAKYIAQLEKEGITLDKTPTDDAAKKAKETK